MAASQAPQKLTVFTKELNPWTPDIDERRGEKPEIVTGTNFYDDVDGPRSAFSSNIVNFNFWDATTRGKVTELALTPRGKLYGTQTGVWLVNSSTGLAEPILLVAPDTDYKFWPWTSCFVGGLLYIAQHGIGLWQYDMDANTLAHISTPVGDDINYIAESNGRLIYLTSAQVAISALDDGTDLTPSLQTGAGAQDLSIIGGVGLTIVPIPDGVLVYTTAGILKGTFVQAAYVFSWAPLTGAVRIFSPNATVFIPNLGALCLDENGFHLTKEYTYTEQGKPLTWEPEKSDYIQKNILKYIDKNLYGSISMFFSLAEQALFVSFSANTSEGIMQTTFVFKQINNRWSSFDHQHTGIFETYDATFNVSNCSYMGTDGFMRAFSNSDYSQDLPADPLRMNDFVYRPIVQERQIQATIYNPGDPVVQVGFTETNFSDNIPTAYKSFTIDGLYQINSTPYSDTNNDNQNDPIAVIGTVISVGTFINFDVSGGIELFAAGYQLPKIGLNSTLKIGPFRFTDQTAPDETSSVDGIVLGLAQTTNFIVSEDWMIDSGSDDWNAETGAEDWGAGNATPNNFDLQLLTSNDGVNPIPPFTELEDLPVFNNLGSSLTYAPMGISGIYHFLTLKAMNPGESYALKIADFSGLLTGRLMSG